MTTFVLVHGAWHDGRCWERVARRLVDAGHRALTPSLTGHGERSHLLGPDVGLNTHVDDVVALLRDHGLTDVVLVGHSYAGMVVSSVTNRVPDRIAQLVYVDALVPTHGETAVDVMPATQRSIDRASGSAEPWRIPPLPELPSPLGLFGVTDPGDVAWLRSTLGDESALCFTEPAELDDPAQAAVPRWHVHCVGAEPPGLARRPVPPLQPNGQPARVHELRAGHDCMLTAPAELTALLLQGV